MRQNELRDGVADLAGRVFTPSQVNDDLLIFEGRAVKRTKATPAGASGTTERDKALPPEVT